MRIALAAGLAAGLGLAGAVCTVMASPMEKLDPRVRAALYHLERGIPAADLAADGRAVSPRGDLDVFIYGDVPRAELTARGAIVRTHLGSVCTAYLRPNAVLSVAELPGVIRIVGAAPGTPALDVAVPATGVHLQRLGGPSFVGANGAGVVVGAVDTGADLDHDDFLDAGGNTRFLSVWDQSDPTGPAPAGFAYGTEWTGTEIDAGTATEVDTDGHGTSVLGIAAGDGSATGGGLPAFTYVGMAPLADLVMVKTDFLPNTDVVDGIAYIFAVAAAHGKNAVANLSLGYRHGPHDGTSLFEVAVDALAGPGRLIFAAAHNWRDLPVHAEVFAGGTPTAATLAVSGSAGGSLFWVDGYYDHTETIDVQVTTPGGTVIGPVMLGNENAAYPGQSTADGVVYLWNGLSYSTVDPEVYLEVNSTGQILDGTWTMTFSASGVGAAVGEVDLWQAASNATVAFVQGLQEDEEMVSEPGNARNVITVGAWSTKEYFEACNGDSITIPGFNSPAGTLASFTSPGPTRDGRTKPDIAAPGVWVGCARSDDAGTTCPPPGTDTGLLPDLVHRAAAGTSMSTPLAAGAGALLLQAMGSLTPDAVVTYFAEHAVVDAHTGPVPNDDWGAGKLWIGDIVVGTPQPILTTNDLTVWPNPATGTVSIRFAAKGKDGADLLVFDVCGRRVAHLVDLRVESGVGTATWNARVNGSPAPPGVYFVSLQTGGQVLSRKITRLGP